MPERGSPNLARRRRLATELRRLRERSGLTGDAVAGRLSWSSSSKLSRIEHGRSGLKPADLQSLLDLYGVTDAHRAELTSLADESRRSGPAQAAGWRLPGELVAFLEAERDAESIWIWEPQVFPGLFQVESYTRAQFGGWVAMFSLPPGGVDRRVETLRLRQEVLTRDPPLRLSAVIDESVLRRRFGEPAVMYRQLKHAVAISEHTNVDVRVLRLDGEHFIGTGAFNYMRFRQIHDVPLNDMVTFDHLTGMEDVEDEDDTNKYFIAFDRLQSSALGPEDSRALMNEVADEVWS